MKIEKMGKWSFIVGVVLAIIAGFFTIPYVYTILGVLGLVVGFLNIRTRDSIKYLISVVTLLIISSALLQTFTASGASYDLFESFLGNAIVFLGASGLVVSIKEVVMIGTEQL